MLAVTTFPPWAWEVYARTCIESWVKAWPGSILAYYEGTAPPARVEGVEYRPLPDRQKFLEWPREPRHDIWLYDANRFCHKVYAQLEALKDHDQVWWLDADVEIKKPIPEPLLVELMEKSIVTFLGRDSYTETGVIAFNKEHPSFGWFENRYRSCYDEGKLFDLPYWTDCHAFDWARAGAGFNLTPEGQGFDNVLRGSVLGEYMEHHKGNLKMKLEERNEVSASL